MFFNRYFRPFIIIMFLVVGLHWLASLNGYYWFVWWYDIMMHFLGGLLVFVAALWAFNTQYMIRVASYVNVRNVLVFVFAIGFLWEVHEIALGFTSFDRDGFILDTSKDFVMDMLGAAFGAFLYRKHFSKNG